MEVHNVPEASNTNTFAKKGKSETFTEYQGISSLRGRNRVGMFLKYLNFMSISQKYND